MLRLIGTKTKKNEETHNALTKGNAGIIRRKRVAFDSKRVDAVVTHAAFFWLSKVEDARGPVVGGGEHARRLRRERKV